MRSRANYRWMTDPSTLRAEAAKIYEQYRNLPNGPERLRLWRMERDLIARAQGMEAREK